MTLQERYSSADIKNLIEIIENKDNYTTECINVVVEELKTRPLYKDSIEKIAEDIIRTKFSEFMNKFDPYNSKIEILKSNFLNKEQVQEIQKQEFDNWMEKREALGFDVWKYAIGAI